MFAKKGIKMTCPNCGGHTRVVGRYGECDYCGSPLVAPIADHVVAEFVDLEIKAIRRHDELYNLWVDGAITEEQKEEMFTLQAELEL